MSYRSPIMRCAPVALSHWCGNEPLGFQKIGGRGRFDRLHGAAHLLRSVSMIVSKATSVYVIMVVVLIGGLWLILEMGSTLMPPTDLAGKWELKGPSGSQDLSVEQSGKFVDLVMGNWASSLKIRHDGNQNPIGNSSPAQQSSIELVGTGESVTFANLGIDDNCTIRFKGTVTGDYQAHRVLRAFH